MVDQGKILSDELISSAIQHMNEDHADAVLAYARGLAGLTWAETAVLTDIDAKGMELVARAGTQEATARIAFEAPLTEAGQLRAATVTLARKARAALAQER